MPGKASEVRTLDPRSGRELLGQLAHLLERHDNPLQRQRSPPPQLLAPRAFPGGQSPVDFRRRFFGLRHLCVLLSYEPILDVCWRPAPSFILYVRSGKPAYLAIIAPAVGVAPIRWARRGGRCQGAIGMLCR